jgi:predicted ATPase/class 3 adenylate cyclase
MRFCGNCGNRLTEVANAPARVETISDKLGVMIGTDLLKRFQEAGLQAAGQRRNVTILFADLAKYTNLASQIDEEDLYEIVQQFINMLVNAVYKYEGMVDKIMGDGIMALFGAPISHENNAERAVRAALDMQEGLIALNQEIHPRYHFDLNMHIGLHSGGVVVGGVGSGNLMDYTAIGDTVNLAQRLESVASPGTILVSESVYRQTNMLFDFQESPDLSLKGISEPVTGYLLSGLKTEPGSVRGLEGLRAPMIGREDELDKLLASSDELIEHSTGKFVLITGEGGLGKSRLVAELKSRIQGQPIRVCEGQSLTYRRSMMYWIFLDVLREFLEIHIKASESEIKSILNHKVSNLLGERKSEILPYLEHLFSVRPSNSTAEKRIQALDGNQLRQQIFIAVRDLLIAGAKVQPLLLILDDLHWADDASLDLLQFLLDSVREVPLLILGITRPIEGGVLAQILGGIDKRLGYHFERIDLKTLRPDQSEQLLSGLLTLPDFPGDLRDQIVQRSAGIPFYLEEILRMLIDDRVIFLENGVWRLNPKTEDSSLGVPTNLQALILTRFDRLEENQRRVLQLASIIGREFDFKLLNEVLPAFQENDLREILSSLIDRAFVIPNPDTPSEYSFRHALTSDAIYSTLLRRERQELHGQVGEAIEKLYVDQLNEHVYLLARHFSWSPNRERALHYLILAGKKAARDYVNLQARQYFERALEILPGVDHSSSQALQINIGLGDVLVFIGEYENARQYYRVAQSLIDIQDEAMAQTYVALRRKISTTFERLGEFDQALIHLEAAQKFVSEASKPMYIESAKNLNNVGWIHFRRGDLEHAEKYFNEALSLVENTSEYAVIASIYNRLGGVYYQKDELEKALNFVRKGLVLREELGDIAEVARSYNNLGLLGWKRGDWDDALENFTRSVELNATLGDVEAMIFLHMNIGLLQTDKGNLAAAERHLEESLSRARQIGHISMEGKVYLHYSSFWLVAKEWEKSLFYSNRALEVLNEIGSQESMIDIYASIGEAWFGLCDLEKAKDASQTALGCCDESSMPTRERGRILRLIGSIERMQKNYDLALEKLKESADVFSSLNNQLELGRTYVALAQLEKETNNLTGARIHAREADLIFKRLGAGLEIKNVEQLGIPQ